MTIDPLNAGLAALAVGLGWRLGNSIVASAIATANQYRQRRSFRRLQAKGLVPTDEDLIARLVPRAAETTTNPTGGNYQ